MSSLFLFLLTGFGLWIGGTSALDYFRAQELQVSLVTPQLAHLAGHRLRAQATLLPGNETLWLDGHVLPFDVADECAGFRYEVPALSEADLPPPGTAIQVNVRALAQVQQRLSRASATNLAGRCIEGAALRAAQYLDRQAQDARRSQSWQAPEKPR